MFVFKLYLLNKISYYFICSWGPRRRSSYNGKASEIQLDNNDLKRFKNIARRTFELLKKLKNIQILDMVLINANTLQNMLCSSLKPNFSFSFVFVCSLSFKLTKESSLTSEAKKD